MVFLDPKMDVAFKKLFGNQAKSEIIISFLNSIMGNKDGAKIEKVTIIDPFHYPDSEDKKKSIVDVKCVDQRGHTYIVEMQVVCENDYLERSQYYAAGAFYKQLEKKQKYGALRPVIFIGIVDYNIFKKNKDRYRSHKQIRDTETNEHDLKHLEWYFIELKKFDKKLNELKTVADKWIYLLKEAENLKTVPKELKTPDELHEALETLEEGAFTPAERDDYERTIDYFRVSLSQHDTAAERGLEKGLQKGLEQGRELGKKEALLVVAKNLLGVMSDTAIARHTGMSLSEIKQLKTIKIKKKASVKKRKNNS